MEFHNHISALVKSTKKSHEHIIRAVCEELGQEDKVDQLIAKLLDTSFSNVKAKKDPNRVKKPKSAYMFFCGEKRAEVQNANPNKRMGDISKVLGAMWQNLSESDRVPYMKMNEEDVDRYEDEK